MTSTLEEMRAIEERRAEEKRRRRAREVANRVGTNLKPHLKAKVEELAVETKVAPRTMVRILLCEALEARGFNLTQLLKAWKENNPDEPDDDDE
jgi:hypothetical protein